MSFYFLIFTQEIPTREKTNIILAEPPSKDKSATKKKAPTKSKAKAKAKPPTTVAPTTVAPTTVAAVTESNAVAEIVSVCVRDGCHQLAQLKTEYNAGYAKMGHLLFGVGCSNCSNEQLLPHSKDPVYLCKHLNNTRQCSFALCSLCYQSKSTDGSESRGRIRKRKTR